MENESLKQELLNMDARLTEMEEKIDVINTKLTQVVDAILGNPLTKTGGFKNDVEVLTERIAFLERKQREFDEFRKRVYWTLGIATFLFFSFQYFMNLYINLKK
jgi:hypothetical protein